MYRMYGTPPGGMEAGGGAVGNKNVLRVSSPGGMESLPRVIG